MEVKGYGNEFDIVVIKDDFGRKMSLSDSEQRELVAWFWGNKPVLVQDIVCEGCPEVMRG